jgi:predicted dehydrogenase
LVNVGIIGLGYWGEKLLRIFNNNCKVIFACSHNEKKINLERKYPNISFKVRQYENLISKSNIDAIVIATPTKQHKNIIKLCAKYKKHVFVEKPLAANIKECKEIKSFFPNDLVLFVGHIFLYHPCYIHLIKHIGKNNISSVYTSWSKLGTFENNFLLEILPHDVSLSLDIFNKIPTKVKKLYSSSFFSDLDHILIELKYSESQNYQIEINRVSNLKRRFMRICTQDREIFVWENDRILYFNKKKNDYEIFFKSNQEPLSSEVQAFLYCLHSNRQKSDISFSTKVIGIIEDINNMSIVK